MYNNIIKPQQNNIYTKFQNLLYYLCLPQQNKQRRGLMKQIWKQGRISGDRRLILLSLLTIPCSILSRLQKI